MRATYLFHSNGYSFYAIEVDGEDHLYEVCLDKNGEDFIGITADSVREARKYAKEWLQEQAA
jgi:hypothetical protein